MNLKTTFRNLGVVDGSIAVLAKLEQMPVLLLVLNCELALYSSFDDGDCFTPTGTAPLIQQGSRALATAYLPWGRLYPCWGRSLIRNEIKIKSHKTLFLRQVNPGKSYRYTYVAKHLCTATPAMAFSQTVFQSCRASISRVLVSRKVSYESW